MQAWLGRRNRPNLRKVDTRRASDCDDRASAPDFREIANRPNVTVASLRRTIAALPLVPRKGGMANPHLTDDQLAEVAAYIMTLREHRANQLPGAVAMRILRSHV